MSASSPDFDSAFFRTALGRYATGVTVVTTAGPDGAPIGLTVSSFNSVSLDPPLVLFSLHRRAFSLKAFEQSGHFAINVLRDSQKQLSNVFAKALVDKWSGVHYEVWETGSPILTDCLANLECATEATHDGGDHVIFIGRVTRMRRNDSGSPLLYYRGGYCSLAEAEHRDVGRVRAGGRSRPVCWK